MRSLRGKRKRNSATRKRERPLKTFLENLLTHFWKSAPKTRARFWKRSFWLSKPARPPKPRKTQFCEKARWMALHFPGSWRIANHETRRRRKFSLLMEILPEVRPSRPETGVFRPYFRSAGKF